MKRAGQRINPALPGRRRTINRKSVAKLVEALWFGAGTVSLQDLSFKSGMHYETLRQFVRELRAVNMVHVAGWRRDDLGRQSIALYAFGPGVDAKRAPPKTDSERTLKSKRKNQPAEAPLEVRGKLGAGTRHLQGVMFR